MHSVLASYGLLAIASSQMKEPNYYNTVGAGKAQSVQRLGYVMGDRGVGVRFHVGVRDFFRLHNIQTITGAHQASYTVGIEGCFPLGKAFGA
jgi:hypothetical protein